MKIRLESIADMIGTSIASQNVMGSSAGVKRRGRMLEHMLHRVHYIVWCSEHGRVSVWASRQVAEPQRNWHELQHLEGVMGKQTVVRVEVIPE